MFLATAPTFNMTFRSELDPAIYFLAGRLKKQTVYYDCYLHVYTFLFGLYPGAL